MSKVSNNIHEAEGLVLRPKIELQTRRGKRIITKIKHSDFKRLEGKNNDL